MAQQLRKPVMVAGDGDQPGSPLKRLEAGTLRSDIPDSEMAQLHDDHFHDPDAEEQEPLQQQSPPSPEEAQRRADRFSGSLDEGQE